MIIRVDETGTVDALRSLIDEVSANARVKSLLVLACDANGFTPESVNAVLRKASMPLFGGVFPQVIHDRRRLQRGAVVAGLTRQAKASVVPNLSDPANDLEKIIGGLSLQAYGAKTIFVFVDGYSQRISDLVDSLHDVLGLGFNYLGGGAGSIDPNALDLAGKPCLLTNQGLVKDSALLVFADIGSGLGVGHGWSQLSGPYRVTESNKNVIKALDWRPAFDVYKEAVEKYSKKAITPRNFFEVSKCYPFGIIKFGSEMIVRDPFAVDENNSLVVAAEIPPESFVYLLTGDRDSLVNAAGSARKCAQDHCAGNKGEQTVLLIDCVSRVLFLEEDFARELDAVHVPDTELVGFLSLGEIANSGGDYMELLNKTAVVGILSD